MDRKDFSNLGENIKEIVSDAVNNMDFGRLSHDIKNTTKDALDEVKAGLEAGKNIIKNEWQGAYNALNRQGQKNPGTPAGTRYDIKDQKQYLAKHPAGRISGIIMVLAGSVFGTGFGITAFVMACVLVANGFFNRAFMVVFFGFFFAAGIAFSFVFRGKSRLRRVKRFKQYVRILGGRTFCALDELASHTGRNKKFIIDDTQKMIADGMFLQGHLDDQHTCLMITDETYQQYRTVQDEYRRREEQEKKKAGENAGYQEAGNAEDNKAYGNSIYDNEEADKELLEAYKEGKHYLDEISKANHENPASEISKKISHMEVITRRIFRQVQSHPGQLEEIRRFMEYYLPTTLKLVTAYNEFDGQPVQGETIKNAKHEIEDTLDTINAAYEKLLDSLFEAAAMDISTDISVMNAMFEQEGLNKDTFDLKK